MVCRQVQKQHLKALDKEINSGCLLGGISLIRTGNSKSNTPVSFKPITRIIPAIKIPKYPPAKDMKTLPVTAQIIPIIEKTIAIPITNAIICNSVFGRFFFRITADITDDYRQHRK